MIFRLLTLNKSELPPSSPKVVAIMTHFSDVGFLSFVLCFARGPDEKQRFVSPKILWHFHTVQTHSLRCFKSRTCLKKTLKWILQRCFKVFFTEIFESVCHHLPPILTLVDQDHHSMVCVSLCIDPCKFSRNYFQFPSVQKHRGEDLTPTHFHFTSFKAKFCTLLKKVKGFPLW